MSHRLTSKNTAIVWSTQKNLPAFYFTILSFVQTNSTLSGGEGITASSHSRGKTKKRGKFVYTCLRTSPFLQFGHWMVLFFSLGWQKTSEKCNYYSVLHTWLSRLKTAGASVRTLWTQLSWVPFTYFKVIILQSLTTIVGSLHLYSSHFYLVFLVCHPASQFRWVCEPCGGRWNTECLGRTSSLSFVKTTHIFLQTECWCT